MKNENNISQDELEEIERFLSNEMSEDEYSAFNSKLEKDPGLREKLKETRLILLGIKESVLENKLESFHSEMIIPAKTETPVVKIYQKKTWLIAASTILVIVAAGLLLTGSNKNEKLFDNYFESDPGLATTMGITEEYEFNRGMVDYKTGNYTAAINIWKKLLLISPEKDTVNYFTGVAYLALDQADSSSLYLQKIADNNQSALKADAAWYLSLALLKQNKKAEAISYLKLSNNPKKDELLAELE